ncbi:Os05g0108050 [Oryza sativa Japonica Group]|uniref:Os05g0108050 protein n=1 Tax=Oryza sativa subsp. japonica TaxID=39947 RepID=C7J2S3_ORYSJ|nr:Os05g0108050 [Oryza sativa Japonica Group]|eukprot:NP_001174171.1 Os05g0108050 [Oryza sativa Japonica Group]
MAAILPNGMLSKTPSIID